MNLLQSYRLALHARKLNRIARGLKGSGRIRATIISLLETMVTALGNDDEFHEIEIYSRKLAPIIWKQLIFLRV